MPIPAAYKKYKNKEMKLEEFIQVIEEQLTQPYKSYLRLIFTKLDSDELGSDPINLLDALIKDDALLPWLGNKCIDDDVKQDCLLVAFERGDEKLFKHLVDKHPGKLNSLLSAATPKVFYAIAWGGSVANWQGVTQRIGNPADKRSIEIAAECEHWALLKYMRENPFATQDLAINQLGLESTFPWLMQRIINKGDTDGMQELLACGADVNQFTKYNFSMVCPLETAFSKDAWPIVKLLLAAGADQNLFQKLGLRRLTDAVRYSQYRHVTDAVRHSQYQHVKELISLGVNITLDFLKQADVHYSWVFTPGSDEEVEVSQLILKKLIIEKVDLQELFELAPVRGAMYFMKFLLDAGFNKSSILAWVAEEFLNELMNDFDDTNNRLSLTGLSPQIFELLDEEGRNLLHWIGIETHGVNTTCFQKFVELQLCDPYVVDDYGNTPFAYLVKDRKAAMSENVYNFLRQKNINLQAALVFSGGPGFEGPDTRQFLLSCYPDLYCHLRTKNEFFQEIDELCLSSGSTKENFPQVIAAFLCSSDISLSKIQRKELIAAFISSLGDTPTTSIKPIIEKVLEQEDELSPADRVALIKKLGFTPVMKRLEGEFPTLRYLCTETIAKNTNKLGLSGSELKASLQDERLRSAIAQQHTKLTQRSQQKLKTLFFDNGSSLPDPEEMRSHNANVVVNTAAAASAATPTSAVFTSEDENECKFRS